MKGEEKLRFLKQRLHLYPRRDALSLFLGIEGFLFSAAAGDERVQSEFTPI